MVKSLEIDCDSYVAPSALYEFSERMIDFSRRGRKPHKQIITICELMMKNSFRKSLSWQEIDVGLRFSAHQDLNQLHSKLLHRLREGCLKACFEIDPRLCKPFNQYGLIFAAKQGHGIQLGCIRKYNGKNFNYAVYQALTTRRSNLVKGVERDFNVSETKQLKIVDEFLDFHARVQEQLGEYRIVREIGSGSTGVVYQAEISSGRDRTHAVAVKLMHEHLSRNAGFVKRFIGNAEKLMGLKHPNIVQILNVSNARTGYLYYVSEFIDGSTLDGLVERQQLHTKIEILGKIIDALAFLHDRGVVHGDLKPANILITKDGVPKLNDFDTSYFADMTQLSRGPFGPTLQYSSEELIIRPPEREPDNDVYAFGILALEFLNGCKDQTKDDHVRMAAEQEALRPIYPILAKSLQPRNSSDGALSRYENGAALKEAWKRALDSDQTYPYPLPLVINYRKQGVSLKNQTVRGRSFRRRLLPQSNFRGATLIDCDFSNAVLSDAAFIGTKLVNCNFDGAFLIMSRFHNVTLEGTHFCHTNLERSVWDDVDMRGVRFCGSNFWGAFLSRSHNLHLADIRYCNFCRTEMTAEQSAYVDSLDCIASGFRYADVLKAFQEFFPTFPESLWWLKMLTDTDATLIMY